MAKHERKERQFFGDRLVHTVVASPVPGNTVIILPPVLDLATPRKVTYKTTYLDFSVSRLLTTIMTSVKFFLWHGEVDVATDDPAQALLPLGASEFQHANANIMYSGSLPIPGLIWDAFGDAVIVNDEVKVAHFECNSMRKVNRANEAVMLNLQGSSGSAVVVDISWRTIYLY